MSSIDRPSQGVENIEKQSNYYNDSYHTYGPCREKTLRSYIQVKGTDQPTHAHNLTSVFVVRFLESLIDKLAARKISAF